MYPFRILAGNSGLFTALTSNRKIKAFISILAELFNGNVLSDLHTVSDLYAHGSDHVHFGLDQLFFQLIRRHSVSQHTARPVILLKDGRFISFIRQIVRAGKSRRPGADDRDLFVKMAFQ